MTSQIHNNSLATRLAARLERNSRRVIAGVLILTALLTVPYFLLTPDTEASQDPSGQIFDVRDDIEERFESEIHGAGWVFESRSGDILTRDGLLEILENSQALRDADGRGELAPERLPVQPYLIDRLDPDTGRTIHGIDTLADAVDEVFRADSRLAPSLADATDDQVKLVIHMLFDDPRSAGLREVISVKATSEPRTVLGQEIIWWEAPAIISFNIAPPKTASLPTNNELMTVGLLPLRLYIPPPRSAVFSANVQLVTVGLLLLLLVIPPPPSAEFPLNVQLVTVGLLLELNIPPP